jgi:predicted 2-oxoglutarate/Fe(II)-dependent dioxygenase YbiX
VNLYLHPRFLPDSLLTALNARLRADSGTLAAIQGAGADGFAPATDVRRAWEVELPDDLHDALLDRFEAARPDIETQFGVSLDPCDAVAALRYPPGAFYRTHRDTSSHVDAHGLHRRTVSLVVFLNSGAPCLAAGFGGGQLRFHDGCGGLHAPHDVTPVAGTLVAFPSGWLHEVRPVVWGTRHTLAAWLAGPAQSPP